MTMYETFLLHARADRALRALVATALEQHKITMMEWLLLSVVNQGPPQGISMSAAAEALDVTLPQITALANKLLILKLVRQKTQASDRRSRHIIPTGKGQTILEDAEEIIKSNMHTWTSELPKVDYDQYLATVRWLGDHHTPVTEKS